VLTVFREQGTEAPPRTYWLKFPIHFEIDGKIICS
jgi:hypothetical protein